MLGASLFMMTQLPFIKEIKAYSPGQLFATVVVLVTKTVRTSKTNKPFLVTEFSDRTGLFTANIWSDGKLYGLIDGLPEGSVISIRGQVDFYDDRFSPKLEAVTLIDKALEAEYYSQLTAVAFEDAAKMRVEFFGYVNGMQSGGLKALVSAVFDDVGRESFVASPAARSVHHSWRHGLLEHTLGMLRLADSIMKLYPQLTFDRDLVIAGIAMHDLCKVQEYTQGLATRTTVRGKLLGHISMIYGIVVRHAASLKVPQETVDALGHIILSHHGKLEYGSPVIPATPEAILVSQVDLTDSRLGALQGAIRSDGDKVITTYNVGLETQVVLTKNQKAATPLHAKAAPGPPLAPADVPADSRA